MKYDSLADDSLVTFYSESFATAILHKPLPRDVFNSAVVNMGDSDRDEDKSHAGRTLSTEAYDSTIKGKLSILACLLYSD